MPWETKDIMSLREEFVCLAKQEGANRRELCRRFGISPQTAYKWLARYTEEGVSGLEDRSRDVSEILCAEVGLRNLSSVH